MAVTSEYEFYLVLNRFKISGRPFHDKLFKKSRI